tara:strand:- start:355 stop:489 length:135 start_codon:yes stop_codon:yes gene_type:complete
MNVKELKKQLEEYDDDYLVIIEAVNAPPWVTAFGMRIVAPDEDE